MSDSAAGNHDDDDDDDDDTDNDDDDDDDVQVTRVTIVLHGINIDTSGGVQVSKISVRY